MFLSSTLISQEGRPSFEDVFSKHRSSVAFRTMEFAGHALELICEVAKFWVTFWYSPDRPKYLGPFSDKTLAYLTGEFLWLGYCWLINRPLKPPPGTVSSRSSTLDGVCLVPWTVFPELLSKSGVKLGLRMDPY
ncbi:chlorophyll a-b binding protein, chloroplastic [Spinacia oleracea]|uniref:Chlorophyll a-b binding protein, chloroplastic n=1 Tax=Spinacia oleracea TaxID=3562 RepID=A0ABM3R9H0_SPIOL|nr:chlorophyll a-b binding protein, chloroplastic-like [Spinacia oleracea]